LLLLATAKDGLKKRENKIQERRQATTNAKGKNNETQWDPPISESLSLSLKETDLENKNINK